MWKRLYKELWAEKNQLLWIMVAMLIIQYALAVLTVSAGMYEQCIMDAFSSVSVYSQSTLYLIVMFGLIALTKDDYHAERVVREKSLTRVWLYEGLKLGVGAFLFAIFDVIGTFFVGFSVSGKLCVWQNTDSYFYAKTGNVLSDVNYAGIVVVFFFSAFLGFFVSAMLPALSNWFLKTPWIGACIALFMNLWGESSWLKYDMNRDVSYQNILKGVDIRWQFLYPFLVIALCLVLGCFLNRKDFIAKGEK